MNQVITFLFFSLAIQSLALQMLRRSSHRGLWILQSGFSNRIRHVPLRYNFQIRSKGYEAADIQIASDDQLSRIEFELNPHSFGKVQVSESSPSDSITESNPISSEDPKYMTQIEKLDFLHGLKSKPVEGGNWNPMNPLLWCKDFGQRSVETAKRLENLVKLRPGDEGYFDVSDITVPGVTIVRTEEQAAIVLEKLNNAPEGIFHACDTEVMAIDLKKVGPVGNGYVTCVSIFSGPDFDYGLGDGPGTALWIDNLDDSAGLLQLFKGWFENPKHLKVWHNYGFDRHVMWNEGIDCRGFGGDTMHMARIQDTSRSYGVGTGYSLEALTTSLLNRPKEPMKKIFGIKRLRKDGSEGLVMDVPPVETLQRDPMHRPNWIKYSAYDAEGTWYLRDGLQKLLEGMKWIVNKKDTGYNMYDYYDMYLRDFGEVLTDMERRGIRVDAKDYLASVEIQALKDRAHHVQNFRRWAAKKIGPAGLAINTASSVQLSVFLFGGAKIGRKGETLEKERVFKVPLDEVPEDALEALTAVEAPAIESPGVMHDLDIMTGVEMKKLCKELGLKQSGNKGDVKERLQKFLEENRLEKSDEFSSLSDTDLDITVRANNMEPKATREEKIQQLRDDIDFKLGLQAISGQTDGNALDQVVRSLLDRKGGNKRFLDEIRDGFRMKQDKTSKFIDIKITGLGITPPKLTANGAPSVTADVIHELAGDPFREVPKFGTAYQFFEEGENGREACEALYSLSSVGSIDTMITNFLRSLQALADDQSRVHGSLNLNTETGRLSSRRPNLQNQPALEKDKYKIRKAFQASPGNKLIVADYGQLELRLLASLTNCQSMINAFHAGGDFHSRTALDMFDYIRESVESGDCLLEWDYSKGSPPKPMLKDKFASERRKAKTLNFSIAYGKTAHGLSADWGVSKREAENMLKAWYDARKEVLSWQNEVKEIARRSGTTKTLMGRYRQLPDAKLKDYKLAGKAARASINTPIQGGAADVAMMAMIKINKSEKLKRLGWILLLQIHDEVILEGPSETAEEAFEEVVYCMENPWVFGLDKTAVPLLVDGSYQHDNWYDAK
jgi:DNA polymerase I-like protein with 3'-5' exonuclease and polymerase domains